MRLCGIGAPILTCAVALAAAGCGTSAPTQKPAVAVTISAPTSGATLGVRQVTVTGTVVPAGARVLVGGQPAQVSGSNFRRTVVLTAPRQILTVTAQADGYVPAQTDATVSYSAALAAQMSSASRALTARLPAPSSGAALTASPTGAGALAQAVALNSSASPSRSTGAHRATSTTPTHVTPTPGTTPTPLTPAPGPIPSPPSPVPTGGGTTPAPAPVTTTPTPLAPSPQAITERIKRVWESNCLQAIKGSRVVPYCTCIYTHLESTGTFRTPAAVRDLVNRVDFWIRTGDDAHLNRAITRALATCQSRFPAPQSVDGPTTVSPLSGTSHLPVPAKPIPSLPIGTTGTTPTPVPVSAG